MSKHKGKYTLCLLALALLLGGCEPKPAEMTDPAVTQPSFHSGPLIQINPTTAPVVTTEPTDPTEETQPPLSMEPVTRLSCIKWRTVPQLLSLGDGAILACRNYFEQGKGIINLLDVVDVCEDKVLAQARNDSPRELVEQQFADGCFILRDPEANKFFVYDRTLKIRDEYSVRNINGYFSYDRKDYYFTENGVLYRMDLASGNYARMVLQYDLRLESLVSMHPDREILVAKCYLSFYNDITGICAIDCKTGDFLLLNEKATHLWFDGDTFYAAVPHNKVYGCDIVYGSLSGGSLKKVTAEALGSDAVSYAMLPGSGILLHRTVDETKLSTTVYDLSREGISSPLSQYGYLTSTLGSVYLRQEQLIFGVYPDDYDFSPVVIDPKALKYEKKTSLNKEIWSALVDRSLALQYQEEVTGPQLPANLLALRLKANALEKKHGVSILFGQQTLSLCGSYAAVTEDPTYLDQALSVLEQALSEYPEGFLSQFRNGIGEGGLYFCLTGRIKGALDPVGKATKNRNRYELAVDISSGELSKTIHHEIWHAIEMAVSTDSFDHPRWQTANPPGFLYYGRYDSGYQQLTQWTYAQSGENCHFVDAYSCINAREDRARLLEYVMTEDASSLLRSDALREKLEIMSKVIRENFNTDGWQTPRWERYLTQ